MTRILLAVVLGVSLGAGAEAAQPAQGQSAAPAQSQSQAPVIKDPAEYNAYVAAVAGTDPNAHISGLEAFLTQYPNSVMKTQALEILMGAYQQTSNIPKTMETANKLIAADPCNERALALLSYFDRVLAQGGDKNAAQELVDGKKDAEQGLSCFDKVTDPEIKKNQPQMTSIYNSAIGVADLQDKDYADSIKYLKPAVDANPNDFSVVYPLALAYLSQVSAANVSASMSGSTATFTASSAYAKGFDTGNKIVASACSVPANNATQPSTPTATPAPATTTSGSYDTTWTIQSGGSGTTTLTADASGVSGLPAATGCTLTYLPDYQNGIWFAARAAAVAPAAAQQQIERYAKAQYVKFHAGEDGWSDVLAAAKANGPQVAIKPAPTPAEQAHNMISQTSPDKMDFATWEFILTNGTPEDQGTVWNAIKGKAVQMVGAVISTTPTQFMVAGSSDDIGANKADITLNFEDKVPPRLIPKTGDQNFQFQGEPSSYTSNPFMMVMDKGELLRAKPETPARRPHKSAQ
jgi:tetratricopeptide (TPR) repeat protein